MPEIADLRNNIREEEVQYRAAVSEATGFKIGGAINFINNKQHMRMIFGIFRTYSNTGNPTYSWLATPALDVGTQESFPYNAEILGIELKGGDAGSSGTTELDIKWAAANSSTYATIFSTTPKIASTAASDVFFDTFGNETTPAGCTVPVLSKSTFAAGDKLRCDVLSVMGGTPNGFTMEIIYRPI